MWVVELNIVGLRFVARLPHRRRLVFSPRGPVWRAMPQRPSRVA
ncbi:hypothetical protein MMON44395_22765 [Mycolicibacterium monacense DSM 44395]|nr:hypothetical protein [Mycolicibacterium monacense DSM 44395]